MVNALLSLASYDLESANSVFAREGVIPGRHAVASPESITTDRGYGFRVSAFGLARNDGLVIVI
jgi:hypothetical protein